MGLKQYNINFNNKILDLIALHGEDSLNEEGIKYWTGDKRLPHPIPFNKENKYAVLFIKKYAQILGRSLSIQSIDDDVEIIKIISKIKVEEYISQTINNSKKSFNYKKNNMIKEEKKAKMKIEGEKVNNFIKEINLYFESIDKNKNFYELIKLKNLIKMMNQKVMLNFYMPLQI